MLATLLVLGGTPWSQAFGQELRPIALAQPAIPTEQTHPGRWEIFAGGHDLPGEFLSMSGVGVNSSGVAYVGDARNKRIQKLAPDGTPLGYFPIWPGWVGKVSPIQSIVVTPAGEIVVLFTNPLPLDGPEPYYLVRYAPDGRPLGQFGRSGPAPEGLERPTGFDVAPDGTVWVADTAHHRLVAYGRDGRLLRVIGGEGTAPGQFERPGGVGIAPNGTLYMADTGNNRVQILAANGAAIKVWDNAGPEPDQIFAPTQIRVGRDGIRHRTGSRSLRPMGHCSPAPGSPSTHLPSRRTATS
jgi:tripartite motif-containing protein 71